MSFKAVDTKKDFPKASEGQHVARCVDFIGPWEAIDDYDPKEPYPIQKVALVWQLDEQRQDGKPFEVARDFTLSFGKKANLRRFIGMWRGKEITDAEAKAGVEIDYTGQDGFLTIEHKEKRAGGVRVEVASVIPLPKMIAKLEPQPYTRAPYWAKRIEEDTAKSRLLQQENLAAATKGAANFDDFPDALEDGTAKDDSDLPF